MPGNKDKITMRKFIYVKSEILSQNTLQFISNDSRSNTATHGYTYSWVLEIIFTL